MVEFKVKKKKNGKNRRVKEKEEARGPIGVTNKGG